MTVVLATVVIPAAGLQPALDCDLLALAEELTTGLGQAVAGLSSREHPKDSSEENP